MANAELLKGLHLHYIKSPSLAKKEECIASHNNFRMDVKSMQISLNSWSEVSVWGCRHVTSVL